MSFNQFLEHLVGKRAPTLLDMHRAFSVIATLYIEDSLNLVNEAVSSGDKTKILARADTIFLAWESEIASLKSAILKAPDLGAVASNTANFQGQRRDCEEKD